MEQVIQILGAFAGNVRLDGCPGFVGPGEASGGELLLDRAVPISTAWRTNATPTRINGTTMMRVTATVLRIAARVGPIRLATRLCNPKKKTTRMPAQASGARNGSKIRKT